MRVKVERERCFPTMLRRKVVVVLLAFTVLAPIILYKDNIKSNLGTASGRFVEDGSPLGFQEAFRYPLKEIRISATQEVPVEASGDHEHTSHVLSVADGTVVSPADHKIGVTVNGMKKQTSADKDTMNKPTPDVKVRHLKHQLNRANGHLSLGSARTNPWFQSRMKDIQWAIRDATTDSDLPPDYVDEKMISMEETLAKSKQVQDDCPSVKKLRAVLHSSVEKLRAHKKQDLFLTQVAAKAVPRGLHCLALHLSAEYYSLNKTQQELPNQAKLENPDLYHYGLFSDNILASAAVVNSTVFHAMDPGNHVFHIVTDKLNYAAMRMWFLANPPGKAAVQVQNIEEFKWLNSSYSPVLKQLRSASMIYYYFRTHREKTDGNLKFRNPKYLSILNHLRFYLPEIFPNLNKVVFLDDDVVVQKDLTGLWRIDLNGKVNAAVETCGENFHRFDKYLNFSNPFIAKNFDRRACGWAYGMNVFDLMEWRRQNITEIYHSWQNMNHDRLLWKLGSLPPGLITFYNRTYPLDRSWHALGLGYNPRISRKAIEQAAVIHYNGNLKPWLDINIPKYRNYWAKFLDFDRSYLRYCNIN